MSRTSAAVQDRKSGSRWSRFVTKLTGKSTSNKPADPSPQPDATNDPNDNHSKPSEPFGLREVDTRTPSTIISNTQTNSLRPKPTNEIHKPQSATSAPSPQASNNPYAAIPNMRTGGPIPWTVHCGLVVFFGDNRHEHHQKEVINWNDKSWFKHFENIAQELLVHHNHLKLEEKDAIVYKKAGRCRLMRSVGENRDIEVTSEFLEHERDWDTVVPVMVTDFALHNRYVNFYLELRWEYSKLDVRRVDGQTYAKTIHRLLHDNVVINWEGRKFIPRLVLRKLFTPNTIHELITKDRSFSKFGRVIEKERMDKFIQEVINNGAALLALAVYAGVELFCVYQLMHSTDYSKRDFVQGDCPQGIDATEFERMVDLQWRFKAHLFASDKDANGSRDIAHKLLHPKVVIPILMPAGSPSIGSGGFGEVFKVQIHSDHHHLSSDRDVDFALKRFYARDLTATFFEKEAKALQALAKNPHPNITLHLASWTQRGRFYMLFPFAQGGNLKNFLLSHESPTLTKDFVLWILTQMQDLAGAVQHIHNSALDKQMPQPEAPSKSSGRLLPHPRRKTHTGFHYDLKPENILLFAEPDPKYPIWRVADFGTAQINEIVLSGSEKPQDTPRVEDTFGDPEYGAPDVTLQGWSSRPYDIWSLGCVYLEILVWMFGTGPTELVQFQSDRLVQSGNYGSQSPAFWYRSDKVCKLKPKVIEKMEELRQKCSRRGVFKELFRLTGDMLTLKPWERLNAPTVHNDISVILRQARHDLEKEDYYLKPIQDRDEIAKPATVVRRGSRTNSIDQRSVEVAPSTPDTQRPTHLNTDHGRTWSKSTLPSDNLTIPGEEKFAGHQWSQSGPIESPNSARSRSPSFKLHSPDGDNSGPFDTQAVVFDEDTPPLPWKHPVTIDSI